MTAPVKLLELSHKRPGTTWEFVVMKAVMTVLRKRRNRALEKAAMLVTPPKSLGIAAIV